MKKEIEIKFKVTKEDNITKKLIKIGGKLNNAYSQTTYGFFSKDSIKKGIFPRIRKNRVNSIFFLFLFFIFSKGYTLVFLLWF